MYRTKEPLTAIIEELLKLEPLVEAALGNELDERLKEAKEVWDKKAEEAATQLTHVAQATSEGGESGETVEGPLRVETEEKEEEKEETPSIEAAVETPEPETDEPIDYDAAIEALYFAQVGSFFRGDPRCCVCSSSQRDVLTWRRLLEMEPKTR